MLQFLRLKYHMKTIGIDQSVSNGASFEHKCFNSIKKVYQHAVKVDDQQKFKDIIEAVMISTPEEITDDSHSLPMTQTTVKKPSPGKSLHIITSIFDVKRRTAICHVGYSELELRVIKYGCSL